MFRLVCAMSLVTASLSGAAVAAADTEPVHRIGLGGYLYPEYDAVLGMLGEPPYALDVGASLWPGSPATQVQYPANPIDLFRYDAAVGVGVDNLDAAVSQALAENPDAQIRVAGVSMGSITIDHYLASLADDPCAPSPDQITFATYADPQRGLLRLLPDDMRLPGYVNQPVPETPYNVSVVFHEYDGFSDFPDRPWNLVASANAVMGGWLLHGEEIYADLDLVPEGNISTDVNSKGGRTTTYRVPASQLPLTMPLRAVVPHVIVDQIDDLVRPVIDRGYSRNDLPGDGRPVLRGGEIVRPGRGGGNDVGLGAEPSPGANPETGSHDQDASTSLRHRRSR